MATLAQAGDVERKGGAPLRTLVRRLLMLSAISCALAVAGCSTVWVSRGGAAYTASSALVPAHRRGEPRIQSALLAPQPPPDCEFKGSDVDALDADLWARMKLDYERQCYQRAESIARERLRQLQASGLRQIEPVRHRKRHTRTSAAPPNVAK